jgi:hypothetical protein
MDIKYYKSGQPDMTWSIDKITTKRVDLDKANDYSYGNDVFLVEETIIMVLEWK